MPPRTRPAAPTKRELLNYLGHIGDEFQVFWTPEREWNANYGEGRSSTGTSYRILTMLATDGRYLATISTTRRNVLVGPVEVTNAGTDRPSSEDVKRALLDVVWAMPGKPDRPDPPPPQTGDPQGGGGPINQPAHAQNQPPRAPQASQALQAPEAPEAPEAPQAPQAPVGPVIAGGTGGQQ